MPYDSEISITRDDHGHRSIVIVMTPAAAARLAETLLINVDLDTVRNDTDNGADRALDVEFIVRRIGIVTA